MSGQWREGQHEERTPPARCLPIGPPLLSADVSRRSSSALIG